MRAAIYLTGKAAMLLVSAAFAAGTLLLLLGSVLLATIKSATLRALRRAVA